MQIDGSVNHARHDERVKFQPARPDANPLICTKLIDQPHLRPADVQSFTDYPDANQAARTHLR